jgi:uncharacterized membrane protein YbhN (UPF0104 family)
MAPDRRRRLFRIAAFVFTLIVTVALAQSLHADGPAAVKAFRSSVVRWHWIALSIMIGFVGHASSILGWRKLLFDMGIRLSLRENIRMFLVGNLGRYLPAGKAWQMGIISSMAAERGFPAAQLAASSLLQGFVGVVIGAALLFLLGARLLRLSPLWSIAPVAGVVLLLALPRILRASTWLRQLLRERLSGFENTSIITMATLALASVVSWCLWGVGLYLLARGLIGDRANTVLTHIVAWVGSLLAGVITVVSPAGLGVRDATMQLILTRAGTAPGAALIVVVVGRVWSTMMEVIPAAMMLAVGKAKQHRQHRRSAHEKRVAASG